MPNFNTNIREVQSPTHYSSNREGKNICKRKTIKLANDKMHGANMN